MTKKIKKMPKKVVLKPLSPRGSAPGSGGLGPYLGGVRNPALLPGAKEQ